MDNQLQTLSKIFTERLFRIPDYQRGYAWTEKQLNDFWNDLEQIKEKENHYTGVLTLEEVPENIYNKWQDDFWIINSRSYTPYYIVDGQQRLTTSIILIQCILENIDDEETLNFTNKEDIIKKFIFDSKDRKKTRSYIFGYEHDNPSYDFLITKIFGERKSDDSDKETIYTQNLINSKNFFNKKIKQLDLTSLERLYKKVTQQLLFNTFTISNDIDVCVAFETMNNRGKPLSHLELLKNRLIYLSLKLNEDEDDKRKLRRTINDCWKSIYHNLGRNKDQPLDDDSFLLHHYLSYFGDSLLKIDEQSNIIFSNRMGENFHTNKLLEGKFISLNLHLDDNNPEKLTIENLYSYTESLQESVEIWFDLFNPFLSKLPEDEKIWLDKIQRLNSTLFHPLILVFYIKVKDSNLRIDFLKAIEKSLFLMGIMYYFPISFITKFNSANSLVLFLGNQLSKSEIDANEVIRQLNLVFSDIKKDYISPKFLKDFFKDRGFYDWKLIRYFLFEYNLSLQDSSKTSRSKIFWSEFIEEYDDFITIEHIYPQKPPKGQWTDFSKFTPAQKKVLRNSLGNLLPLSRPKNSSLSNKAFLSKVKGKDGTNIGYQYGCYAENEIAHLTQWTSAEILERGTKLLTFMEKRWSIKLGSKEEKTSILGLEFLNKNSTNSNS